MAVAMRSIGQVLEIVREEFPDISISKIRYLESEGLLSPERDQPSGYRRYAPHDIDRLRYILRTQRDQYLPLKVIREHLERMDAGLAPASVPPPAAPEPLKRAEEPSPGRTAEGEGQSRAAMRLTRRQLLEVSGLPEATLIELERHKIIVPGRRSVHYGRDALTIAIAARRLSAFGLDARHLRLVHQAAAQEAGLIDQVLAPYLRQRADSRETVSEVVRMVVHAHVAMLQGLVNR